jgi:hypothetical protein
MVAGAKSVANESKNEIKVTVNSPQECFRKAVELLSDKLLQ